MIIHCSELIKEESGNISIGNCYIGDDSDKAVNELCMYSRVDKSEGRLSCWMDVDLMWPRNVLADKDVFDASIYCTYNFKTDNEICQIELEMRCFRDYPFHLIAEFQDKLDLMTRNSIFEYRSPNPDPESMLNNVSIVSKYCVCELIWTKKEYDGDYFVKVFLTPNS